MKDDAISRQAVLKLLSTMPPEEAMTKAMLIQSVKQMDAAQPEITLESAINYLHSVGWMQEHDRILTESVQPERKRGRWIAVTEDGDVYKRICSCCGREAFFQDDDPDELYDGGRYELSDFCPHCGADMREVNE